MITTGHVRSAFRCSCSRTVDRVESLAMDTGDAVDALSIPGVVESRRCDQPSVLRGADGAPWRCMSTGRGSRGGVLRTCATRSAFRQTGSSCLQQVRTVDGNYEGVPLRFERIAFAAAAVGDVDGRWSLAEQYGRIGPTALLSLHHRLPFADCFPRLALQRDLARLTSWYSRYSRYSRYAVLILPLHFT